MATVKELRETAKAYGIKGYSRMSKSVLQSAVNIAIIQEARKAGDYMIPTAHKPEQQTQHETSRDILEAHCRAAYDCTNTEDMHSILDVIHINALAGMCRLVNATISSSPTKAECIDAFISAAMEHKAIKAAREAQASASTPATFTINPEVKPDYDAAFDEYAYSPACQFNRAIFDDERESRMFRPIKRRPATTGRRLPTPKNPHGLVVNFSLSESAESLHKFLNGATLDIVKVWAESFREFQPRTDGKPMTKKDYVTAIVRLYFPDYQPKKPAQEVKRDCMGDEIIQCGSKFIPGKFYVAGLANYRNEPNPEPEFIKVIKRKNDTITVQVVSYPDFQPVFKPVSKKAKQFLYYYKGKTLALYESITLPNSHDYEGEDMWIASLCEYNAMFITAPGYDVDFDETAYSPDVKNISVLVDDIPADHEPDVQEIKPDTTAPVEPEHQQKKTLPLVFSFLLGQTYKVS